VSVVGEILTVAREIKLERTVGTIFYHMSTETVELYDEIYGDVPGEDGVIGEAVDVMLCAVDIMYKQQPDITEEDILKVVRRKLNKWQTKYGEK